ncbi:MAG TPA: PAS domain S-box protein [Holophagaceae bacterium]|nr:PAS domain S-box protein [Holophagaceae bacterium]
MSMRPEDPKRDPSRAAEGAGADPEPASGSDFQELFDRLPDPAWIYDKDTKAILAVNEPACRRYGWSREEFLAMSMADIRPPEERQRFLALVATFPPVRELRGESRHWTKDGSDFLVDVDARDIHFRGRPCRFVSARDAFERKMAWIALQETQDTYSGLVENLAEGVAILDEEARFIYVNAACGQIFGLPPDSLLGRTTLDFIAPEARERHAEELRQRASGEKGSYEIEVLRSSGERRWLAIRAAPRRDSSGRFAGTVASFFDITDHRLALEAHRQIEARFRRLVEMLPQGLVTYQEGRITYANPAATAITRTDPGTVLGRPIADFVHPSERTTLMGRYLRIVRGEDMPPHDYTFMRGDGSGVQVEAYGKILEPGEKPVLVSVFTDLTRRLEMERALREQEQLLRLVSDHTRQLIYDYAIDAGAVRWIGPMQEMLGLESALPPDAQEWGRRLHPEDLPRVGARFREGLEGLHAVILEYRVRREDGAYIPVEDHGVFLPGPDGRAARMIGTIRDISDRYASEQALRDSEERYRSVIEQAQEMIFIVDLETRAITETNRSFHDTLGYPAADMGHLTLYDLVDADRASVDRNIGIIQRQGSQAIGRRRYRRADGGLRDVEVTGSICRAGGQEFMVVLARDITARLASEMAMQQSQKLESLGVLAGGIAHDFNNLLTAMMGNLSLAQLRSHPSSPGWPYLDALEKSLHRAADLTRQMLAYSGKGRFVTKVLDLNQVVEEMTHLLSVSISKRVALRFDLEKDLPPFEADPAQLQQVVMNLVTNASDAIGDQEGAIRVATGLVELGAEQIQRDFPAQAVDPGPHLMLEVADTGCGMSPETQLRIFEPFFTTKAAGRGLGLSAMLGILKGHRAGLRIQSAPGQGTTIRIFLPARSGLRAEEPSQAAPLTLRPAGAVLVVDDEPEIRMGAAEIFKILGFPAVLEAADGEEAVEIFKARGSEISLVFMDLTMPRMNGRDAFRALRALDPGVRVILTSGYNEEAVADEDDRPTAFLQKPYRMRQLRDTVMAALQDGG